MKRDTKGDGFQSAIRRLLPTPRLLPTASLIVVAIGACAPPVFQPGDSFEGEILIETVVENAAFPVAIAFAPDGRAFYTEKETGRIRVLTAAGELLAEPFADVAVVANSERGLLGIALHPDFAQNGFVYVFYTSSSSGQDSRSSSAAADNRVVRFTAVGDTGTSETLIVTLPAAPGPNHNGGNIRFGPDGKLYITLGELASASNSQTVDVTPGKILRYNDDGTIPDDNPFGVGNPAYILGLRNSFDFAFDPVSGVIFATENGTNLHDEVNRLPAGANGGWPLVEGFSGGTTVNVAAGDYVEPVVATDGIIVPTGIDFAPDATFGADSETQLFMGEFLTGRVTRLTLNEARTTVAATATFAEGIAGGITDVAFAPDGTLYVLTTTSIQRIRPDDGENSADAE